MGEYMTCPKPCGSPACARYGCFVQALGEESHGRIGATDAVDEAVCQSYHGMSQAEWYALPEPTEGDE